LPRPPHPSKREDDPRHVPKPVELKPCHQTKRDAKLLPRAVSTTSADSTRRERARGPARRPPSHGTP
jgi:hypothetical protein